MAQQNAQCEIDHYNGETHVAHTAYHIFCVVKKKKMRLKRQRNATVFTYESREKKIRENCKMNEREYKNIEL